MAVFELQGPDGKVYEVDAPDAQTAVSAFQRMGQPHPAEPAPPLPKQRREAIRDWADENVRSNRAASPVMTAVDDTVRRLTRGTPVGSWLDEANALTRSVLPGALGGIDYERAKALEDANDRIGDEESTRIGSLPVIGDVTASGLTKLGGGIASAPIAPIANVFGGATLLPRMANVGISGAGYGGLYGAGEGEGDDRIANAGAGFAMGGLIGSAAPAVAQGIGNAAGALSRRMQPLPQGVQQFDRSAVDRVNQLAAMDDITTRGEVQRLTQPLGGQGMLADVGENLRMGTEGLAQQPGPASRIINDALDARANGAPGRISRAVNETVGPPTNVNLAIDANRQQVNALARPHYDAFYSTRIPVDQELVAILQAVPDDVWPRVNRLMRAERLDPNQVMQTGRGIDLIKRGLDDAARAAGRGTNEERVYSNLARDLRNHVDGLISPDNPAASSWARARAIAEEGYGAREALQDGSQVFTRGVDPMETANMLNQMNQVEQAAFRTGASTDLRNTMGRAATNFRANGDAAARRRLNSDFNRENLRLIAGGDRAEGMLRRIDAENTFAETRNQVTGNSATARRQAMRDIIPRQYEGGLAATLRNSSVSGLAAEGVMRIANLLTRNAINDRNQRVARDMAQMLVAQGGRRDEIARGLMDAARQTGMNNQQRQALNRLATHVMRGAASPSISAATGEQRGGT